MEASQHAKKMAKPAANAAIVFIGLLIYMALLDIVIANADLSWLQNFEAGAVFSIQRAAGVDASFNSTQSMIAYTSPEFSMYVVSLCTGIGEMLFFAFLLTFFRGPSWKAKAKGLALFLPAIFMINIVRLLLLYPLALWLGADAMWGVHWLIWKYGMLAILLALFGLWLWKFDGRRK